MDKALYSMIEQAYSQSPDREVVDQVAASLKNIDVKKLPLWQQAHSLAFLKRAILPLARDNDHVDPATGYIDPDIYKDSIAQMQRLQDATQYSGGMSNWLKQRQKEFAFAFMRHPDSNIHSWNDYSLEQKTEFAQRFVERMLSVYFRDFPNMPVTEVVIFEHPHNRAEISIVSDENTGYIDHDQTKIHLNENLLKSSNFYTVMTVIAHEVTHLSSIFLGELAFKGLLDKKHPAYEDAQKSITLHFNKAWANYAFHEIYISNPEEKMAFDHEDSLVSALFYQSPSLRFNFYRAGKDARIAFDKISAALGPIINNLPRP